MTKKTKPSIATKGRLGDFTANPRLLLLTFMALFVGVVSALVAKLLLWLIAVMTKPRHSGSASASHGRRASARAWLGGLWGSKDDVEDAEEPALTK